MSKNKLGDVILDKKGSLISGPFGSEIGKKYFVKEGIPVIRGNNLSQDNQLFIDEGFVYITEQKAQELNSFAVCDDLIFTAAGTIGQVGIIPTDSKYKEYTISNKQIRARLDLKKVNPYYVYFWCNSPWINRFLKRHDTGSTVPLINLGVIKDIPLNNLELNTQNGIVNFLRKIDKKIETNNKINTELEKMAKTLYDYWFVQFDFPDDEGKPYRTSGGVMTYNSTLKREIPKNWEVVDLLHTKMFKLIKSGIEKFDGYKTYLATADIDSTKIINFSEKTDYKNRLSRANMQPKLNSVWFAKMKDTVKNLLINKGSDNIIKNCILSTGFTGFECNNNAVDYIWNYLRGDYFEKRKNKVASGATQQAINEEDLKAFYIIEPSEKVLSNFEINVRNNYLVINKNNQQNKQLAELRDFLLPLLMTGQVQVVERQEQSFSIDNGKEEIKKDNKYIDQRFDMWLETQGLAARGEVDKTTLRAIFDEMDDEDK